MLLFLLSNLRAHNLNKLVTAVLRPFFHIFLTPFSISRRVGRGLKIQVSTIRFRPEPLEKSLGGESEPPSSLHAHLDVSGSPRILRDLACSRRAIVML